MPKRQKPASKKAVPNALDLARILETADPAVWPARAQQLRDLAAAPVFTLVIQVDSRAPDGAVWVSNIGPAISGAMAHMMLAAATRQLAERQAQADAQAKPPANGKAKG